jgi:hypothetical protein
MKPLQPASVPPVGRPTLRSNGSAMRANACAESGINDSSRPTKGIERVLGPTRISCALRIIERFDSFAGFVLERSQICLAADIPRDSRSASGDHRLGDLLHERLRQPLEIL